jgi:hypothetical protein
MNEQHPRTQSLFDPVMARTPVFVSLSMTTTVRVNEKKRRRGRRVGNAVKGARCWRSSRSLTAFPTPSSLSRVGSEALLLLAELPTLAEMVLLLLFVLMTKNSLFAKTTFR